MATVTGVSKTMPRPSDQLSVDQKLQMLSQMMLIRRFEERTMQAYQQTKIGGFCHIYIGQEATAVGSIYAMNDNDPIITAYRDHGHALARGMHPNYCMAEMFGKISGCAKGKGGSMHMFDKDRHMYGGHAIVGGQCPLGIGLAFATKYENDVLGNENQQITLCYFGDGAINQGGWHEAFNLAAIQKLPIIFIVENNGYSMGTETSRGTAAAHDMKAKADAYGMNYDTCDGQDALATYDCFSKAAADIRQGGMPYFMNVKTYRYKGHSMSDPQKYRSQDEVKSYEANDCIKQLADHLTKNGLASEDQIQELDNVAKKMATDSIKYAEAAEPTPMSEMFTDVYSEPYENSPYKVGELPLMMRENNKG